MDFEREYSLEHGTSAQLYERAVRLFPSGVTHDGRFLRPFPIYVTRSLGPKKWDVDGHEYIDYWMGHGSLILGHRHQEVVDAIHRQVDRGTHYGACHELELEWAERIIRMVPSAQKVRFTSSGTEASLMAIRLARAYTGKGKVVRFAGHYHGWHDILCVGIHPPFDLPSSAGIPEEMLKLTRVLPPGDVEALESQLREDRDVACVILEPSGGASGAYPLTGDYLRAIRSITERFGVVLIFDEVITGFRYAPGGAQECYGVTPDLSCLAKIVAGGLPGGAVAGRKEILEYLEFKEDPEWNRYTKMYHPGTFNANPMSAAAGVATLDIIARGEVVPAANKNARAICNTLNEVIDHHGINWCVHGEHSIVHIVMNHRCRNRDTCDRRLCTYDYTSIHQKDLPLLNAFRIAMLSQGIDSSGDHWWVSCVHGDGVVERTGEAFDRALQTLEHNMPDRF